MVVENQDKIIYIFCIRICRKVETDFEETKYPLIISIYWNDIYIIKHSGCTQTHGFSPTCLCSSSDLTMMFRFWTLSVFVSLYGLLCVFSRWRTDELSQISSTKPVIVSLKTLPRELLGLANGFWRKAKMLSS